MKYKDHLLITCFIFFSVFSASAMNEDHLTQYVDPIIGSAEHGHVFVGANVPFGFVQLGPTSIPQGWDWCSGYNRSDSTVIGFAHTHLSGTGCGDLHDITVMPVVGKVTYDRGNEKDQNSGLWSYQDRQKEIAKAGYYATYLQRYNIGVELTATSRVGLHKYTFPQSDNAGIVFDLVNGQDWDRCRESMIHVVNDHTICGYRYSSGWANDERIYFRAEFSKPFKDIHFIADGTEVTDNPISATAKKLFFRADFSTKTDECIYVKVALSPTSVEGAALNMNAELPDWDFKRTADKADSLWECQLQKIRITTQDIHQKRVFYTSLFHTMIAPSDFCDVNGDYYGADHQIHRSFEFHNYTTFSLWDTYRAAHPLMTIIHPEMVGDIINTMIGIYNQQGKLPIWHLMGCETNCMVGYPAIPVVADAIVKNIKGFDYTKAYDAMTGSTNINERGLKSHRELGYIPTDSMKYENVAYEMEYDIADWALAQAANKLGHTSDYQLYMKRSHQYRTLFDKRTDFIRAKNSKGEFHEPFDAIKQIAGGDDYCEGNAWQYTWLVPHDLDGLIKCFGSKKSLMNKLDSLFIVNGDLGEKGAPDITGLIGQYAHGNEPSHHIVYFYTILGKQWKAADLIRRILTTLYTDKPDGLPGNEDVGQMSAWYILSALGFYQVEPAGGRYIFGTPLYPQAEIVVPGGKFIVKAYNNSERNRYIKKILLNGKPYNKYWIDYSNIIKGGKLEFYMTDKHGK
jgi:predicted alpha-1,2-mannosidase